MVVMIMHSANVDPPELFITHQVWFPSSHHKVLNNCFWAMQEDIWISFLFFLFCYISVTVKFKSDVFSKCNGNLMSKKIKPNWRTGFFVQTRELEKSEKKLLSPACKCEIKKNVLQLTLQDSYQILTKKKQGKSFFTEVVSFFSSVYCYT